MNGDGRPDVFVAGYTNMADPLTHSVRGFPGNYAGVRDLLFLNEGNAPNGHAVFKEVGREAGLESANFLPRPRRHLHGHQRRRPTGSRRRERHRPGTTFYINEPGGPLGFHFVVDEATQYGITNHNAGMGVAEGDFNGDGRPDLFITNSRGQPHAAYESAVEKNGETGYKNVTAMFAKALAPQVDGRLGRRVRRLCRTRATST